LGGIGIQPSVVLIQDAKAIEDLLTADIVFLIRPKNMKHNRDVVENGPRFLLQHAVVYDHILHLRSGLLCLRQGIRKFELNFIGTTMRPLLGAQGAQSEEKEQAEQVFGAHLRDVSEIRRLR
jgi:hypothetical protein